MVGLWAKAGWQDGLGDKLGLREVFDGTEERVGEAGSHHSGLLEDEIDVGSMNSTSTSDLRHGFSRPGAKPHFASRVSDPASRSQSKEALAVPPMLAYIHPSGPNAPLIHRVDTAPLLLSVSLRLAKLESVEEVGKPASSPFAHAHKIAYPQGIAEKCTVTKADCLIAENVTVEEKSVIKESVIGANCHIKSGARLARCILMDGAVVGEGCQLTGCILGRRSQIGKKSVLKECEVQEGNVVPEEMNAKEEKFMVFQGLSDDEMGLGEDEMDVGDDIGSGGFEDS